MSIYQELEYTNKISEVQGIQFSILSPEEIRRRSVCEVFTQETYEGDKPKIGGLFDPRMGVLDHGKRCPTDHHNNRQCPGYPGHIELAAPIFNLQFMKYIINILKCVCWKCSRLLVEVDKNKIYLNILKNKSGINRFLAMFHIKNKSKNTVCQYCNSVQPSSIKKDPNSIGKIIVEWKSKTNSELDLIINWNASDVLKIFTRILDDECELMGFSRKFCRPEWLICTVFAIPPPSVRPSVKADNNTRMEDDLTHKLCDIIKTNRTLKHKLDSDGIVAPKVQDDWYQLLQYHCATYVDNTIPGIPPAQQRSGRPIKSVRQRLRSKEGRVRGNLMGKRVDFSARSVITPDPNIGVNELGVPYEIAKNLTYPEIVTKFNIQNLRETVKNGYDTYPGAKSIKRFSDKKIVSLKIIGNLYELQIGDIINRHLIDGDIVLFNRQPSLHKMSMMAHIVKVLPYKTFRLNVSVTTPYNADFDGDEMNMHVPQSLQTAYEIEQLALVETQILTPATHKPIIALVQDTIIGSYLFTRYDNYLTKREINKLVNWIKEFDGIIPEPEITSDHYNEINNKLLPRTFPKYKYPHPQNLWSGRQIFSMIMPDINLTKKNLSYDLIKEYDSDDDERKSELAYWRYMNTVKIIRGNVVQGVFDKGILGTKEQGIIHIIYNEYGPKITSKFINDTQNIITNWVLLSGFSVGLGDLIADDTSKISMSKVIDDNKNDVITTIEDVHKGRLVNDTGKANSEEFEFQVMSKLNKTTTDSGKIGSQAMHFNNRMTCLVNSGSKGSDINIAQMIACVGQQSVDGKRIPYGFTDRTLPHFHKYDDGSAARGFVENSYVKGLTPTEFFFHAMGGREGLIDTAVKTSETGYIQRKLVKGMEDVRITLDYTVRNAKGEIIQFLYGEDGVEATKIEKQSLLTFDMDDTTIREHFGIVELGDREVKDLLEKHINNLITDREIIRKTFTKNVIYCPINLARLVNKYSIKNSDGIIDKSNLDDNVKFILDNIKILKQTLLIPNVNVENKLLNILINCYLSPKNLLSKNYNRQTITSIFANIKQRFFDCLTEPGELVGVQSAQSIGEPSTQMTLNTFHFAGVSSKSQVTRGLPRFRELLSTTKNLKSPLMRFTLSIELEDESQTELSANDKQEVMKFCNDISNTYVKDLVQNTKIKYISESDIENIISQNESENKFLNKWCLIINLDRFQMVKRQIKMIDLYCAIYFKFSEDIYCDYSDDNSSDLNLIIVLNTDTVQDNDIHEDTINLLKAIENTILNEIRLSGISNLESANYTPIPNNNNNDIVIETEGSNILELLSDPRINSESIMSNDIYEMYQIYGIEACRNILISEITEIFEQSSSYVNSRHISLLVDVMTNKGGLMSIDRHGINKSNRGPLAKCSFEETPDIISKAAIFGEYDSIDGVSANIMLGQEVPIGTGSIDILFDEEFYKQNVKENIGIKSDSDSDSDCSEDEIAEECQNMLQFTDTTWDEI